MQLAFEVRQEKGEEDDCEVYPNPDCLVLKKFRKHKTRSEIWTDLPDKLAYSRKNIQ